MTEPRPERRRKTDSQYLALRRVLIGATILVVICFAYSTYVGYAGRKDQRDAQVAGCGRGKLDRKDNADFQRAYARYNLAVTSAASVKEDVKTAARQLRVTVKRTSASLASRTGPIRIPSSGPYEGKQIGLDCGSIPKPSLLP